MLGLHRSLPLVFLSLVACLAGCDGPAADPDAGPDTDAFVPPVDAGPDDGGSADAGPDAGTPPTPLEEAVDTTRADVVAVDTALAAVPAVMRAVGGEFLETDITRVRLDAIVGEKSLIAIAGIVGEKSIGTRSLPLPVAPLLVILHNIDAAIASIGRATSGWSDETDPTIVAVRDALATLGTDLAALRTQLLARFRELVTPTEGLGRSDAEYADYRPFTLTPDGATIQVVLEADPADPEGTATFECGPSLTDLSITVHDAESGAELLAMSGATVGGTPLPIALRPGTPTVLRVRLAPGFAMAWTDCSIAVTGHRYWRGASQLVDEAELSDLTGTWAGQLRMLDSELGPLRSSGSADELEVVRAVELFAAELSAETGIWRRGFTDIDADEHEVAVHALVDVMPALIAGIEASPQLAGSGWANVRAALASLRATNDAAMTALSSPPPGA